MGPGPSLRQDATEGLELELEASPLIRLVAVIVAAELGLGMMAVAGLWAIRGELPRLDWRSTRPPAAETLAASGGLDELVRATCAANRGATVSAVRRSSRALVGPPRPTKGSEACIIAILRATR